MSEYSAAPQFIDLAAQQKLIRPQLDAAIKKVLDHGQYIMGPEVEEFERQLREFVGAKHALSCANGTDALSIVLMAWDVGPGDAVFVPSFTYVASAESPAQLGATPFFVDVCESSFNIDPVSLEQAIVDAKRLGLNPKVVIAVDLFGQPADSDAVTKIAHSEGIKVLIDAAQSFGATSQGRNVGTMGDAVTTSFFPAKPLGCYGDGGAIFTGDDELAQSINSIRLHGKGAAKYDNVRIGINSRLDTIQAAILKEKLKIFPNELELRSKVAATYGAALETYCKVPRLSSDVTSSWAQYTIIVNDQKAIQSALTTHGIPSVIYYPIPLARQIGYSHYPQVSSKTLVSEKLASSVLSLPMHPYLTSSSQSHVLEKLIALLKT